MAQIESTIPPKGLGSIQLSDFWKSLLIAAGSNLLLGLYAIINTGAFPTQADWIVMLKSTTAIIISYLLKNLGTNNVGQLFQKDKPIVHVDAAELQNVLQKVDVAEAKGVDLSSMTISAPGDQEIQNQK